MTKLIGILFILLCTFSCTKYPEYPNEPRVSFVSAEASLAKDALGNLDKNVELRFMLYDGNGDIGHSQKEIDDSSFVEISKFYSNFFVKKDGDFVALDSLMQINTDVSIPQLRENGRNKFIKAEVTIDIPNSSLALPYDTLFLTFFVTDRANNQSNIDTSAVLVF